MINNILKKIEKANEVESKKIELASHNVELAKSLKELDAMYAEIQKAGANTAQYISTLRNMVNALNNTGKSQNVLTDRFKAEVKSTIDAAKQLGLEVPLSTQNNIKFVDQFKTKAKAMFDLANAIDAGLKKL